MTSEKRVVDNQVHLLPSAVLANSSGKCEPAMQQSTDMFLLTLVTSHAIILCISVRVVRYANFMYVRRRTSVQGPFLGHVKGKIDPCHFGRFLLGQKIFNQKPSNS